MAFGVKLIYVIFYVKTETCCNVEGGKTLVSGSDNEATQDNTESETESQAWAATGERWHTCHTSIWNHLSTHWATIANVEKHHVPLYVTIFLFTNNCKQTVTIHVPMFAAILNVWSYLSRVHSVKTLRCLKVYIDHNKRRTVHISADEHVIPVRLSGTTMGELYCGKQHCPSHKYIRHGWVEPSFKWESRTLHWTHLHHRC